MMRRVLVLLVAAAVVAVAASAASAKPHRLYAVTDLGTLGGSSSDAYGINDAGVVVGSSQLPGDGASHGFVFRNETINDLGTLPGGTNSVAYGINKSGQIAGTSEELVSTWPGCFVPCAPTIANRAFSYDAGRMVDLGLLGDPNYSYPYLPQASFGYAINDDGDVAGAALSTSQDIHAVFWSGGTINGIPFSGWATSINNSGQAVGVSAFLLGTFLYSAGQATLLPSGGASLATPWADINEAGHVAYSARVGSQQGPTHAQLFRDGVATDLGTLGGTGSFAYAVNRSDEVVGSSQTSGDVDVHAFAYRDGQIVDLNDVIAPASGWVLNTARAINKSGQIVGTGAVGGQSHAFLLTP